MKPVSGMLSVLALFNAGVCVAGGFYFSSLGLVIVSILLAYKASEK